MSEARTLEEIRTAGLQALEEALGPEGTIRFLQQFDQGRGDYTSERHSGEQPTVATLHSEWLQQNRDADQS